MTKFTRKHYREIALVLKKNRLEDIEDLMELDNYQPYTIQDQWLVIRDTFVELLKKDNPRFKEDRFLEACEKKRE
jgi:hypothetical protein